MFCFTYFGKYIIQKFTKEEKGVRNLKRCIEIVFSKLNLYRLMKPDSKLFSQDIIPNIEFPFNVTKEHVDKLIKYDDNKILVAVTEKRTKTQIDNYVQSLAEVNYA